METQQILDIVKNEVQAGNLLSMDKVMPCDDFFTAVDECGNPVGGGDFNPEDPKTWEFVLYRRGFCHSTHPEEPFTKMTAQGLQCQMIGKFLAYYPFAEPGARITGELVGSTLAPGRFLIRIGKPGA